MGTLAAWSGMLHATGPHDVQASTVQKLIAAMCEQGTCEQMLLFNVTSCIKDGFQAQTSFVQLDSPVPLSYLVQLDHQHLQRVPFVGGRLAGPGPGFGLKRGINPWGGPLGALASQLVGQMRGQ